MQFHPQYTSIEGPIACGFDLLNVDCQVTVKFREGIAQA
jgi:hypothetical protein